MSPKQTKKVDGKSTKVAALELVSEFNTNNVKGTKEESFPDTPAVEGLLGNKGNEFSEVEHSTKSNLNRHGTEGAKPLTIAQKALIELNRQKALIRRQENINKRKLSHITEENAEKQKIIRINDSKLLDTGGGFFIEETETGITEDDIAAAMVLVTDPAPLLKEDQPFCSECSQPFDNSYLFHNFDEAVCDVCRDREDKHSLITKTDAKNNYLLNDVDFEKRIPPLKYIVRKNPHNSRWGDMKLYLKLQVERRALEVWETEEALEKALQTREESREASKRKKYLKKMKELRMNVRSSLYTRATKTHQHEYGEEVYHSDEDEFSKTCKTCNHSYKYDKM